MAKRIRLTEIDQANKAIEADHVQLCKENKEMVERVMGLTSNFNGFRRQFDADHERFERLSD